MTQREKLTWMLSLLMDPQNAFVPSTAADYLIEKGVVVLPCRCRECTHRRQADNWCGVKADFVSCNGYCNYAERR